MTLPVMNGIYIVVAVCAISIYVLRNLDPLSDFPQHPMYDVKTFFMMINIITFIYLFLWLAGIYVNVIVSILL